MGISIRVGRVSNLESADNKPVNIICDMLPVATVRDKDRKSMFSVISKIIKKIKEELQRPVHKKLPKVENIENHIVAKENGKFVRRNIQSKELLLDGAEVKEGVSRLKLKFNKSKTLQEARNNKIR